MKKVKIQRTEDNRFYDGSFGFGLMWGDEGVQLDETHDLVLQVKEINKLYSHAPKYILHEVDEI